MSLFDRKTAQVLTTILAFAAGLYLLWSLRVLFFMMVLGMLLAYAIEPMIQSLQRMDPRRITRARSIGIVFVFVLLSTGVAAVVIGQMVSIQAAELISRLPSPAQDPSSSVAVPLPSQLEPYRDEVMRYGSDFARTLANSALGSLGSAGLAILVPVFAFFFLRYSASCRHDLTHVAARFGEEIWLTGLIEDLNILLSHFIRALLLQSLAVFIAYGLFYEVLDVPYAMLLATVAAVLELIPVLGWFVAASASLLLVALSGYPHWGWMIVFYIIFRLLQDYVFTPFLMSKGIQLSAFAVIAGVIGGEMIAGVPGMFLSIPLMAATKVLYRHWKKRSRALAASHT